MFYVHIWEKVFKNGPSKIQERQPLKNLKGYGLLKALQNKIHSSLVFIGIIQCICNEFYEYLKLKLMSELCLLKKQKLTR